LASPESFGHTGFTGTFIWADPQQEAFVIFLSNRVYPYRSQTGLYDLNIRGQLLDYVLEE
jgi:CubicO group peptidase (beta-lactamase class C family)